MVIKNSNPGDLDFQSENEAWNNVRLVLQGETLIVKYPDDHDERFTPSSFEDFKKVESFFKRFRLASTPLQSKECKKISKWMTVSASHVFGKDDVRFYDAVVEEVNFRDHKFGKEEECTCSFTLLWLLGPNVGNKTEAVVADICLLQHGNARNDPTLSSFMEVSSARHKVVPPSSARVSRGDVLTRDTSSVHNANSDSLVNNKNGPPQFVPPVHSSNEAKISVSAARTSKVRSTDHLDRTGEDMDLGGRSLLKEFTDASNFHFLLIDNLEKDLSPSAVMDFVRRHLSINSKAQVFPSLSSESYTKGIIMVDSQVALQKLSDFLNNPSHMILSSKGRPWVMIEKNIWCGATGAATVNLIMLFEKHQWDRSPEVGDNLRVVSRGTKEYERGKKMKDLFLEFTNHQQGLHHRLTFEESKILQSPLVQPAHM